MREKDGGTIFAYGAARFSLAKYISRARTRPDRSTNAIVEQSGFYFTQYTSRASIKRRVVPKPGILWSRLKQAIRIVSSVRSSRTNLTLRRRRRRGTRDRADPQSNPYLQTESQNDSKNSLRQLNPFRVPVIEWSFYCSVLRASRLSRRSYVEHFRCGDPRSQTIIHDRLCFRGRGNMSTRYAF